MSNRFVRASKFRHVFGTPNKKEKCYDNIKISKQPHESNMSAVNAKFLAVVLEAQGGGAFFVAPLSKVGRFDINYPKVSGHKSSVLDLAWNPFNDNQIASASEDCTVMIWDIPDEGLKENMSACSVKLEGHQRKVLFVLWHPTAENILVSAGIDHAIIVWNTQTGEELINLEVHPDQIHSISWNHNGSLLATTCKDKKIRVIDIRQQKVLNEGDGHLGTKPSRVVFCGTNRLFTTGFSRMSDRQYALWDIEDLSKSLTMENIGTGSGVLFPFFDEGNNIVYILGKGDSTIRYFEVEDEGVHFLSMYSSKECYRGMCSMPKRELDYMKCEVARFYLLDNKNLVTPLMMQVPRKSDLFQDDIYPPCASGEPSLTAEEWASGMDADPKLLKFTKDGPIPVGSKKQSAASGKTQSPVVRTKAPSHNDSELRAAYEQVLEENASLKKRIAELESRVSSRKI